MRPSYAKVNIRIVSLIVVSFLALQGSGHAQQMTGGLQFKVVDSLGYPVAGVNATVIGANIQGSRGGASDASGYVNVLALQPGRSSVKVSHSAYQPMSFENVLIQLGKTTSLGTVLLRGQTHELPELVISSVRSPLLDPGTTHSVETMRAVEFEGLPVDRNYRSVVSLLPQANASYFGDEVNVGGATGMENKYFVDGVDVTESFLGYTGTNLPYNFVSEIEVREGGYEAEYPSALGGVVNVITPSGGNEFHGSAFGFFTSNRFMASKRVGLYDPTQGGFSHYDVGLGIGGPFVRDALWFYVAYNPTMEQRDVAVPGFGISVDRYLIHSFAGKLTWRASPGLQLMLMTTGDPTEWHAVGEGIVINGLENPDPYFSDQKHGGINVAMRGTYAPEGGLLLDASFSRTTEKGVWQGATERGRNEVLFRNEETGVWSGGLGFFVNRFIYTNTFNLNGTLVAGTHTLKGGFQYKFAGVDENDRGKRYRRFNDSSYSLEQDRALMTVGSRIPSLYVQDTWRILETLRLHLGLRWDSQYIIGSDGSVGQKFTREFQPRAGINFVPDGSQKIFASFGRYYQELSSVIGEAYTDQRYYSYISYDHDPRIDPSGGDTIADVSEVRPESADLTGQYYDEFTVGYERLLGEDLKAGVRGIYRTLREVVGEVYLWSEDRYAFGNPGRGTLSQAPRPQRNYTALVFTMQGRLADNCDVLASYVLSRNYGNYPGLYDPYNHLVSPNGFVPFGYNVDPKMATGLLPNDRGHVFKCSGAYRFGFGLTAGASFLWQSGTPLSEEAWYGLFLAPRGTSGRTPSIWDLSLRFLYDVSLVGGWGSRLILDIFHVGSPQKPVDIDQRRYLTVDANLNPEMPNPFYGMAYRYQPAMSVRLGMEVKF